MTTTIAVIDVDQLREVIRSEIAAAFGLIRSAIQAAAGDLEEVRRRPPADPLGGGLIDAKAVAKHLGVDRREMRRLVHEGSFPAPLRIGRRRIRWRMQDVVEWTARSLNVSRPTAESGSSTHPRRS